MDDIRSTSHIKNTIAIWLLSYNYHTIKFLFYQHLPEYVDGDDDDDVGQC